MSDTLSTQKNIKIPYPSEGVIRTAQLDDTVAPTDSVQIAVNMNFDRVGAITTRLGLAVTNAPDLVGQIKAFGTFNINNIGASVINRLLAQAGASGTLIYSWDGTINWTLVRTLLVGTFKARFTQYLNLTWMVNGQNGDPVQTFDGATFGTTLVPAGFPQGDYIQAGFEGRVWVAIKSLDIIYFTDIVQFTPPSTYSLTFDATTNFIKNFSPQDGETITGMFTVPRAMLVFKQNHIYRVYGAFSVDSYAAYNVGTYSQESIVETKDGVYFHHSSGFYKFNYDGQPTEISRRVIDFVRAISLSNYENVTGVYDGFDNIEWQVGSVTVEGVTFSSCVMRYTISTQVWTIYDYAGNTITAMIRYNTGSTINSYVGTSVGKLGLMAGANTDFGQPIYFEFIDRWRSYTEMYAFSKSISGINVYSENAAGANLTFQAQKDPPNVWDDLGTVDQQNMSLFPNAQTDDFEVGRLRIAGNTKGTPIVIHGIELLSINVKGLNQN